MKAGPICLLGRVNSLLMYFGSSWLYKQMAIRDRLLWLSQLGNQSSWASTGRDSSAQLSGETKAEGQRRESGGRQTRRLRLSRRWTRNCQMTLKIYKQDKWDLFWTSNPCTGSQFTQSFRNKLFPCRNLGKDIWTAIVTAFKLFPYRLRDDRSGQ